MEVVFDFEDGENIVGRVCFQGSFSFQSILVLVIDKQQVGCWFWQVFYWLMEFYRLLKKGNYNFLGGGVRELYKMVKIMDFVIRIEFGIYVFYFLVVI